MLITAPQLTDEKFKLSVTDKELMKMPCGLHRANIAQAFELMPELHELYENLPQEVLSDLVDDPESWLIDVKIHMLMRGQFPCIPNWHCDNVPRDDDGNLQYGEITPNAKGMYLYLSGAPKTEFIGIDQKVNQVENHGQLDDLIKRNGVTTQHIPSGQWVKMWQNTPHRGVPAMKSQWRLFVRLTHKSLVGGFMARQQVNPLRRHAQVYLPYDFNW